MRGKGDRGKPAYRQSGITPAYAGKRADYGTEKKHMRGSPPRVRGKGISRHGVTHNRGITPAYAGKSLFRPAACSSGRDHPRVCGEKFTEDNIKTRVPGSPPRMRGKVASLVVHQFSGGITPAYAGKSRPGSSGFFRRWDHPRVCGEKTPDASSTTKSIGSPPRVRGKALR